MLIERDVLKESVDDVKTADNSIRAYWKWLAALFSRMAACATECECWGKPLWRWQTLNCKILNRSYSGRLVIFVSTPRSIVCVYFLDWPTPRVVQLRALNAKRNKKKYTYFEYAIFVDAKVKINVCGIYAFTVLCFS